MSRTTPDIYIYLPNWGNVSVSDEEYLIIKNPAFQRLKNIRQHGLAYTVFSGAKMNRYDHSIGVGYLAGVLARQLQITCPEITDWYIILTKIAGVCHDIGHGPFSHLWDEFMVTTHEERSCILVRWIMESYPDRFSRRDIRIVQAIINPENKALPEDVPVCLSEIICNTRHCLDVDRLEYISSDCRFVFPGIEKNWNAEELLKQSDVINGHWEFRSNVIETVNYILKVRKRLYKACYHNYVVVAMSDLLLKALILADKKLGLSEASSLNTDENILKYINADDSILQKLQRSTDPDIQKAQKIAVLIRPCSFVA